MIRPKGLGRGLDALLAGVDEPASSGETLRMIAVDRVRPGKYQPRSRMDQASLAELARNGGDDAAIHQLWPVTAGLLEQ